MVVAVVVVVRITTDVHAGCGNSTGAVICRGKVVVVAEVILVVAVKVFVVDLGGVVDVVDDAIHHFHDPPKHDVFSSHGAIWSDV